MHRPHIIGITGGIGSGKSTLSADLRELGFEVYDSDKEARRLQNEHPVIVQQLKEIFGADIYNNNVLNRGAVAKLVFENKELLQQLNKVVHPVVKEDFENWIRKHTDCNYLFMESAILFESGFNAFVDKVVVITAPEEVRIKRVVKRDGVCAQQVRARIASQIPEERKIAMADIVIYSDDEQPMMSRTRYLLTQLQLQTQ